MNYNLIKHLNQLKAIFTISKNLIVYLDVQITNNKR